jgi:hypothetical protein
MISEIDVGDDQSSLVQALHDALVREKARADAEMKRADEFEAEARKLAEIEFAKSLTRDEIEEIIDF